ncbi:MAG: hypothetical protein A2W19_15970 [Spirochaetes bacterium RBG_16_49_21]|nr:MAG: hypothetical protein A2W19_15970 [Spirochaetes bacterium RBG_16_49_21]
MKLILEIENEKEQKKLEKFLKSFSGKITSSRRSTRPIESLLLFAEKNAVHVQKVAIPSREARNER